MFRDCSNLSIVSSQYSQHSEFGLTPKENDQSIRASFSPMRKKGKVGRTTRMYGEPENNPPSLFNLVTSQDSILGESQQSAFSQDVVNRLGQLSCRHPDASLDGFEEISSLEAFSIPTTSMKPSLFPKGPAEIEGEKKIVVAPSVTNPFLPKQYIHRKAKKPTVIWIQPYKERPRYISDFEEEATMGGGSYSTVYAARKRLDGTLYALKKLKERIFSESEGIAMTKEVCALAALKGCPNLIQYFGSWVEDGHLWLQTELCLRVNLDIFVPNSIPPAPTLYRVPDSAVYGSSDDMLSGSELFDDCESVERKTETADVMKSGESNHRIFTEEAFWRVLLGICNALSFMHSKKMAHLDIRPANIFLSQSPFHSTPVVPTPATLNCPSTPNSEDLLSNAGGRSRGSSLGRSLSFRETSIFPSSQSQCESQGYDLPTPGPVDDGYVRRKRTFDSSIMPMSAPLHPGDECAGKSNVGMDSMCTVVINDPELVARNIASGAWEVKVGDLGLCCSFNDYASFTEGEGRYCAGELINGASGTQDFAKADMFSVGASLLEMCTGLPLAGGGGDNGLEWHALRDGTMTAIICSDCTDRRNNSGKWLHRSLEGYSDDVRNILRKLLHPISSCRPSAASAREFALQRCTAMRMKQGYVACKTTSPLDIVDGIASSDNGSLGVESAENEIIRLRCHIAHLEEENRRLG